MSNLRELQPDDVLQAGDLYEWDATTEPVAISKCTHGARRDNRMNNTNGRFLRPRATRDWFGVALFTALIAAIVRR